MLLAIICPEAVTMWAFRQRLIASMLSKRLILSMTHGFFISMGGFVGKNDRPLTAPDFFVLDDGRINMLEGITGGKVRSDLDISPILSVTKEELMDKSKGDALSEKHFSSSNHLVCDSMFFPNSLLSPNDPAGNCHASLRLSEFLQLYPTVAQAFGCPISTERQGYRGHGN
ncbi:hypothetical protein F5146DRAFT_221922 [Armillaria mellea]|nr:hypothetical protein F5146DRAFT_221922 [Armillaria mellea]